MQLPILLISGDNLEFRPGLPQGYKGPRLPGAVAASLKTNTISMVSQLIAGDHYFVRYIFSRLLEKIRTVARFDTPGLYIRFQLRNSQRHIINQTTRINLRQDQCTAIWMLEGECQSQFVPGREYQSLDFYVSPALLAEYLPIFPRLKEIINEKSPDLITGNKCWIGQGMHEVLEDLLNCPFDAATRQLYYDIKVREIITHLLHYRFETRGTGYKFSPWELKHVHEARDLLREYIAGKPPTLRALAKRVNLSEIKLKDGFHYLFHCSIFDWLMEEKMKKAKELLLRTNEPIKEICLKVGYPRVSNFITAFRKRFGHTPGSYRRS